MVNHLIYRSFVHFCMFCLPVFIFVSPVFASEATDLAFIRKINPMTTAKPQEVVRFNPQETSELKLAVTGLIRLYQKFISSQDSPTCSFSPSCSRFCMACIQEYGVLRGVLLTADRLLRCNGSQSRHYHRDGVTGKYIDPASDYAELK
ncbi:MAG: membrane protein insertion efficiency factor YidD [Candidatus Poribacteria bacterium]|nr:membrane protein insertion efficiency factor YidD [Candidatus Poribacteria bacterium]